MTQFVNTYVRIYTDGACHGNPGRGGYASIIIGGPDNREAVVCGSVPRTTNNRMELKAVIEALKVLEGKCNVDIYSDSRYVVETVNRGDLGFWMTNGWRRRNGSSPANQDLWEELAGLLLLHIVRTHWIPGHSGLYYNERCDRLANAVAVGRDGGSCGI